jgi:hypothetical protein
MSVYGIQYMVVQSIQLQPGVVRLKSNLYWRLGFTIEVIKKVIKINAIHNIRTRIDLAYHASLSP